MTDQGDDNTRSHVVLVPGTQVLQYRIVEKIGAGGMGEVYLTEDTKLNRRVALKFLPAHLADDADIRTRFTREARAAATLNHPNIITIHEVGEFQGRPFICMEYVEGESLHAYAHDKRLAIGKILELAIQICDGLAKAHQSGIIHRDIKTTNIVVDGDGRARILDFGLAQVEGEVGLTKSGSTLGTVAYMSPEQVRGELVDQRSDLFSFGIVLYELVCGCTPFKRANETSTLQAILTEQPEPLSRYKATVPDEIQRIILKALEKDPSLRYQSAADLLGDLRREKRQLDSGESAVISAIPAHKKKPWRIVLAASGLLVLVALLLILKPWKFDTSSTNDAQATNNWLAVMYFDNVADPADSKRMGEISTNLLVTALSESHFIKVISTQRLYDLLKQVGKGGAKTIDRATASQVAQKAEAHWMLTGSILQSEPTIVLTSQLIDVSTGGVVASQRISGKSGEGIFTIVDKLSAELKKSEALPSGVSSETPVIVADVTTHSLEAYKSYLEGMENIEKAYDVEAAKAFHKAINLDSTFASAYMGLAMVSSGSIHTEAIAQSLRFSDRATERERMVIRLHYLNGVDSTAAYIQLANEYLQRFPDDKMIYRELAERLGTFPSLHDSAVSLMNKLLKLDPEYKQAYNTLAYLYSDWSQFSEAEKAISKYIDLAPNEANPYDTRGDIYATQGKLESAIASYRKALSVKSDYYNSLRKLGLLSIYKCDYKTADSCIQSLISTGRTGFVVNARFDLTWMALHRGKFREAIKIARKSCAENVREGRRTPSENVDLLTIVCAAQMELGYCDSSLATWTELTHAITNERSSGDTLGWLDVKVRCLCMCGNLKEARSITHKLEALSAKQSSNLTLTLLRSRACVKIAEGDYMKGAELFIRSDSISTSWYAVLRACQAYIAAGAYSKAVPLLLKITNDYSWRRLYNTFMVVDGYYRLGVAYEGLGEKGKAIAAYKEYLRIMAEADPEAKGPPNARARLALLQEKL